MRTIITQAVTSTDVMRFIERLQMRIGELDRRIDILEERLDGYYSFTLSDEEGSIQ